MSESKKDFAIFIASLLLCTLLLALLVFSPYFLLRHHPFFAFTLAVLAIPIWSWVTGPRRYEPACLPGMIWMGGSVWLVSNLVLLIVLHVRHHS